MFDADDRWVAYATGDRRADSARAHADRKGGGAILSTKLSAAKSREFAKALECNGRSGRIRTCDPLVPNEALYCANRLFPAISITFAASCSRLVLPFLSADLSARRAMFSTASAWWSGW